MEDRYLFKAKRIDNGEWEIGNLIILPNGKYEIANFCAKPPDSDPMWKACVITHLVDPSTLCQCTGLYDRKGKLIWENDIIKAWSQGMCAKGKIKQRIDGTWIMYPAWQKGEMWYLFPDNNGKTTVEIIGNIFDNPELLRRDDE